MGDGRGSGSGVEADRGDLDIRILRRRGRSRRFPVLIRGPEDRQADGEFRSPFRAAELDDALEAMDAGELRSAAARAYGERLYQALFTGSIEAIFKASHRSGQPPRIRLTVDDPEAARIPWELLVDPTTGSALVLRGLFVRGISTQSGARPLTVAPPLRILVADSAPRDLLPLEAQLEASDIEAALEPVARSGRIEVVVITHVTPAILIDALRESASADPQRPFHVLHWIGHGDVDLGSGTNILAFESDTGTIEPVDGRRLADILAGSEIRLVVLNACHSAAPAAGMRAAPASETAHAIAESLLTSGIPAVIGMRVSVADERARTFARELYRAVADGVPIDQAVLDARRLIVQPEPIDGGEVGIPVLYLRTDTGRLLEPPARRLPWLHKVRARYPVVGAAIVVATFVVLAVATNFVDRAVDGIVRLFEGSPEMTGTLNVVVTEFAQLDEDGEAVESDSARRLSINFADRLGEELDAAAPASGIQIRGPEAAGRLEGGTPDDRAAAAARLADEIGAHVVVYASVDPDGAAIQPEFYVHDQQLPGAEELEGRFRLGAPIEQLGPLDSVAVSLEAQQALVARTRALAQIVIGLSYFAIERYGDAEGYFTSAESGLDDDDWQEVVQLFIGTTAGQAGRYDEARRRYEAALRLNPDFARARLGLAEVKLQESKGTCEHSAVDPKGLRESEDLFRSALLASDRPNSAHIPAKVQFGVARIAICSSQALVADRWAEAQTELDAVIDAFEGGETTLETLAGQAHELKALALLPTGPTAPGSDIAYQEALRQYDLAITLDDRSSRTARYYASKAFVLGRLARVDEARAAYGVAIDKARDEQSKAEYRRLLEGLDSSLPTASSSPPAGLRDRPRAEPQMSTGWEAAT